MSHRAACDATSAWLRFFAQAADALHDVPDHETRMLGFKPAPDHFPVGTNREIQERLPDGLSLDILAALRNGNVPERVL